MTVSLFLPCLHEQLGFSLKKVKTVIFGLVLCRCGHAFQYSACFLIFFSTLCRNGSPSHQPEPVVQVLDVSTHVFHSFWIYCLAAFCITEALHINIHKCKADIWVINLCLPGESQPTQLMCFKRVNKIQINIPSGSSFPVLHSEFRN